MSKIDLRLLLPRTLVANSNQPCEAAHTEPPGSDARPVHPSQASSRTAPASPGRRSAAHPGPPVRPHRALRPRRRS